MFQSVSKFKNEAEERQFWSIHSPLDFKANFQPVEFDFSELKPSTKTISIRLPESMIQDLKKLANKKDVPYQSLLKVFLSEKIHEEVQFT